VLDVGGRRVRNLDRRIDGSITGGSLERTIDGASTLTITLHDPQRVLLRSGAFGRSSEVRLDRLYWRLAKVSKTGDDLTLTFEDREVSLLRAKRGPKKPAPRSKVTRAEFALSLVREVKAGGGITFVCPELHVRQKVAGIDSKKAERTDASRATNREKGLSRSVALTVKGAAASTEQKRNAERVLDVADSLDADDRATLALLQACIVESTIRNLNYGDRDSRGILQVRDGTAAGMSINNRDVSECANAFLTRGFYHDPELGGGGAIALARRHPDVSTGRIAQATQGSARPAEYDKWYAEAKQWLKAYTGSDVSDTRELTRKLPYQFRRGGTDGSVEDSWTCLQRLAQEVNWRCFMSAGSLYFVSETTLLRAKPRLVVSEDTPGVLGIDFDVDVGKPLSEVTITARASRWIAAPGAVVQLEDCGPADGRWLVSSIERGLFDATATITLRRPTQPLPEPAPETVTESVATTGSATADALGGLIGKAYAAAERISEKHLPYVWGGGHAHAGTPDRGTGRDPGIGYDCSGAVSAVLANAGMGFTLGGPGWGSAQIASSWGEHGEGQGMTVWSCPDLPQQAGHAFIVFHTPEGDRHWGTGHWGSDWSGPGFKPQMHHTTYFTPRHWPGT